jgi:Ca2+-binding EF-hand superfamily protein
VPKPAPLVPREELTNEQMAAKYFALADYDADGAITYFEAQKSLGLDRAGLAIYDKDHDGRISPEEFEQRYVNIVTRGGVFQQPVPKPKAHQAPRRTAPELLQAYDQTPDGGLDERELRKLLEDYAAPPDPPVKVLLATLDRDASHKLDATELEALVELILPKAPESEPVKKQTWPSSSAMATSASCPRAPRTNRCRSSVR